MDAVPQVIRNADLRIYYFLSRFAGNWILARLARFGEENNLLKGGVFFALYWGIWFRAGVDREKHRKAIIRVLIAAVLSIVVARTIAFLVPFRMRPVDDPGLVHPSFPIPLQFNLEHWSSFPSDTASYFFALAFGIAYLSRRFAVPILLYTSIWICLSRIYLGIHYTSDIIAGIAIGIAAAWIALKSTLAQSIVARPVLMAEKKPQLFYPIAFLVSFEMATVFDGLRSLGNAAIHALGIGMHIGFLRTGSSGPIDTWGGVIAIVACVAVAAWVISASSGGIRSMLAIRRRIGASFGLVSRHKERIRQVEDISEDAETLR